MPIYEYYCESCDDQFEILVFRSSDPVGCPSCNTENVKRMLSVFGFKSGGDKGAASSRMGSGASNSWRDFGNHLLKQRIKGK